MKELLSMKTTKLTKQTSLIGKYTKDLKVDPNAMNEAMDLTIKPRKNVVYTYRNFVHVGG
jgi:hypothetical protein